MCDIRPCVCLYTSDLNFNLFTSIYKPFTGSTFYECQVLSTSLHLSDVVVNFKNAETYRNGEMNIQSIVFVQNMLFDRPIIMALNYLDFDKTASVRTQDRQTVKQTDTFIA